MLCYPSSLELYIFILKSLKLILLIVVCLITQFVTDKFINNTILIFMSNIEFFNSKY